MTELARPDLARNRSGRDHVRPGPAPTTTKAMPADRSGLLRSGPPVPGWAVGTALLAPVVLVGGWLTAGALQPASYGPMHQTISALAGQSGTDRWVMTTALLLVGGCQIATGAGLTAVRMPARILPAVTLTGRRTVSRSARPSSARRTAPSASRSALRRPLPVMGHMRHYGANCNGRGGWSRWTRSVSDRDAKLAGRRAACARSPPPWR